jgi:hypothetical protein
MIILEQNNWTETKKLDYLKKKIDSNYETRKRTVAGKIVYEFRKKEETNNWTETKKLDYLKKKSDSNYEVRKSTVDGKIVYEFRKKEETNNTQPTTELPDWVPDCVKNGVKSLSGTTDPNKVVYINDKGDKWYFSKNGDFLYIFKSGKRISGDYVCDDNDVVITTDDGEVYRGKNKKWLKKVTDSELQKKLKDKDDTSFWEDIKIGVPSLINKAGEWFHDMGEDAKKWWNDWRKEENNGNSNSSCNTNGWLKDPTGSKKYVFKVIECKWYTKNVSTCKEFNISDNLKYKRSVDILNNAYPNELKNCNKNQSSVNEPSWVKDYPCIRGFGEALPKNSDSKVSFKSSNGLDILNFYKNSKFSYEHESGEIMNGTWKCENNVIIIDTDDKARFTSGKGWDYSKVIKKDQEIIKKDYEISPDDEIIYKQVDKDEF